jgi:hypothetical protein
MTSMLAAVGAIFAVTGGVLAFTQFPGAESASPELSLNIAPAASRAATPLKAVALPAARVAAPGPATQPAARGSKPGRGTTPGSTRPATPGTGGPGVTPPVAGSSTPVLGVVPSATPQSSLAPVATAVEKSTGTASGAVRALGSSVPVAEPVTSAAADAIDGAGALVGSLVLGISHGR